MLIPPNSPSPSPNGAGPASGSGGGSQAASQAANDELGKNDFLRLLVAQLGNQDPTNPMEGREFAAQLAQFTSVEQLTNISGQIQAQQGANDALTQSINSGVATDLIGRTVEAGGTTIQWTDAGEETTIGVDLDAPASEATITIRDAAGNAVHTQTLDDVSDGSAEITWDGTADGGGTVPEGSYTIDVSATDADGNPVGTTPYITGTVDRVTFGQEGTQLWVDGIKVSMGRVRSVATE